MITVNDGGTRTSLEEINAVLRKMDEISRWNRRMLVLVVVALPVPVAAVFWGYSLARHGWTSPAWHGAWWVACVVQWLVLAIMIRLNRRMKRLCNQVDGWR